MTFNHRRVLAITAALLSAATFGSAAGMAQADTRNACQDLRNQQRAHEDLAGNFWDLEQMFRTLGYPSTVSTQVHELFDAEIAAARNADWQMILNECG